MTPDPPAEGVLLSWTVVHRSPAGMAPGYALAVIDVTGELVLARAEDPAPLAVGDRVRVNTDENGRVSFAPVR